MSWPVKKKDDWLVLEEEDFLNNGTLLRSMTYIEEDWYLSNTVLIVAEEKWDLWWWANLAFQGCLGSSLFIAGQTNLM